MWIKSLRSNIWINMNHVTHFTIEQGLPPHHIIFSVYAYLDTSAFRISTPRLGPAQDQASVKVHQGTSQECEEFIKEQLFLQSAWQWIGYLVAGGVGAVLTLIFT